ncbi:glycosyltransferase family 87 protein [Pararhodobacter aggregans]|uniref:glycosyltransferase family 87 protein n=1 Tax=Pararhodobacter aggregans TaxID=404875 RepID=UPI003A93B790
MRSNETITRRVFVALVAALLAGMIWHFAQLRPTPGADGALVDFDAFYLAGQLVAEGRAAEAYDPVVMRSIQEGLIDRDGFMPWTYPPQFDLVVVLLQLVPRGLAYALFIGLTLAAYLWLLARLSGPQLPKVLLSILPPVCVTIAVGQNSFLIAALMAGFVVLSLQGRAGAGWPLGLLVIKPHLGIGLGLHAALSRRWPVVGIATGVVLASSALATVLLGPGIWPALRLAVETAQQALSADFYPFFRMTSSYALFRSLGASAGLAMAGQIATALLACGAVTLAVLRNWPLRHSLAVACFAAIPVSPYVYDYDMAVLGVGFALIARDLAARCSAMEDILILTLFWVAGGWGMAHALGMAGLSWEDGSAAARATLSFGAAAYLLLLALIGRILSRPVPA